MSPNDWLPSACVLCSENCGIEVQVADGHLVRIKGDRRDPASKGYLCDKALRLDHYQHHRDRLTTPLRRTSDGRFEPIGWDTAIGDIARRLLQLRSDHGARSLAFYGGAGQGNQLALPWAVGFRMAMGTPYMYHALGQEKTGEFWLDGHLFGSQACHTTRDIEHTDFVVFSGTNPWHAHGFPRARKLLREIAADPKRTMVVIDPRRTETAELADIHLQVRPGTDAFVLAAMVATIIQEDLHNQSFLEARTIGFNQVRRQFLDIPVDRYAEVAGVDPAVVRRVARGFATAPSACVRSDLGLQQSLHSTLNLYLEKLLCLVSGQFGKRGGNTFHAQTIPLLWDSDERAPGFDDLCTRVKGMFPIAGFYPPNILASEIDSDHPERLRGLVVDSANPATTAANTPATRKALSRLDLLVVIDKDMTETAELAHYVLPAPTQFEKYECTFFNWGFPENHLHVRHPVLPPTPGTLPEPEIYRRLATAMGEDFSKNPLLGPITQIEQLPALQAMPPDMRAAVAPLLMASMGFVEQHRAAVLRAGVTDEGDGLAVALFKRIVTSPSGAVISLHEYEDTFAFIKHADGKIHLAIEQMFEWLRELAGEAFAGGVVRDADYPLMASAGERRASNATTNYRDPAWRHEDQAGVIRVHADDAARIGVQTGDWVHCASSVGAVVAQAQVDDTMLPGAVSLPHGFGLAYTNERGQRATQGPQVNMLSPSDHCDRLTKTPYHKNIPVRLRKATDEDIATAQA
ncbi:MAG: molybdopterin-dependent oxidoreductase [Acidobacteriota bacterium]